MRRLLAMLGFIRPDGSPEVLVTQEAEECGISIGGLYYLVAGDSPSGPYWSSVAGEPPPGYLPEPDDMVRTFGDDADERLLSWMSIPIALERKDERE